MITLRAYRPAVHHYCREHAPNRRYLPSDIDITSMHADYNKKNQKISLESYRKAVKAKNIGFSVLGNEKCEKCTAAKLHRAQCHGSSEKFEETCRHCKDTLAHLEKAKSARDEYRTDSDALKMAGRLAVSADLQKVIMLPQIPGCKSVLFTRRIIAFNETFAILGGIAKKSAEKHFLVVWNEVVQGRRAENICSAFWQFLKANRDCKEIVIWMDNCAAQNKNWVLFTMFLPAVNGLCEAKTITLKYLEAGHTFMSADSVHHGIEKEMKQVRNIYDWGDFVSMARNSNSKNTTVWDMQISDFQKWKDGFSKAKQIRAKPRIFLKDIVCLQFRQGQKIFYYKKSFKEDFLAADLLKQKFLLEEPQAETIPRGISAERKGSILTKLGPLMPVNRKYFWEHLHESDAPEPDLTNCYGV